MLSEAAPSARKRKPGRLSGLRTASTSVAQKEDTHLRVEVEPQSEGQTFPKILSQALRAARADAHALPAPQTRAHGREVPLARDDDPEKTLVARRAR